MGKFIGIVILEIYWSAHRIKIQKPPTQTRYFICLATYQYSRRSVAVIANEDFTLAVLTWMIQTRYNDFFVIQRATLLSAKSAIWSKSSYRLNDNFIVTLGGDDFWVSSEMSTAASVWKNLD